MTPKSAKRFSDDIMLYLLIWSRIQISGRCDLRSSGSGIFPETGSKPFRKRIMELFSGSAAR